MTSKLQHILPVTPSTRDNFGGPIEQHNEQTSFLMLNQRLPPNTLITVSSNEVANSTSTDSSLKTNFSVGPTNCSPQSKQPTQVSDSERIREKQAVPTFTADETTVMLEQAFHNSSKHFLPKKKSHSKCQFNVPRSTDIQRDKCSEIKPFKTCDTAKNIKELVQENIISSKLCGSSNSKTEIFSSFPTSGILSNKDVEIKKKSTHDSSTFCFVCNMEFVTLNLLEKHKGSKQFFCRVCVEEFDNHNKLEVHLKSHRPMKCRTCKDVFFSKRDLFQHKEANKVCNDRIECEICNKKFYEGRCLRLHKKKYHSDSSESYKCIVCSKTFNIFQMLHHHLKRIHLAYEYLECKICNILMVGPDRLKQHVKATHLEAAEGDIHVCPLCKKVCSTKSLLRNHMEIHDNEVRLCELCGKSVEGKQPMRRHMAKEHSKTGFFCKACKQQFNTLSELRKHVKHHKKPVDESVYCEICGKKLKNPHTLKIHLQIHSEVKPFKCDSCGACFKQEVTLKTHQRVHSEIGKYFCSVCGLSFRWKQTFDKHVKKCGSVEQNSFHERLSSC